MKKILIPLLLVLFAGCAQQAVLQDNAKIVQSPNDKRQYEYLVLPNDLKVLLISDAEADKAAAALTVGVGSTANPKDRAGLAHFLEHMLFMGTEKYPGVDEYAAFIKKHGGSRNAFTAENITTYFFDIKHQELEPALDRFAQFFIAPLFAEAYVDREKNAVHSEYQLKLKDDSRRIHAAQQKALNPASPYANFSVGNLDTLSDRKDDKVRDDLIVFYQKYYSANQMTLAVLGRESIPELRQWATAKFSAVPNNGGQRFVPSEPVFTPEQLPLRVNVVPLKDIHKLELEFPLPSTLPYYQEHPTIYLAHFIGHEGKGSLLSLLKSKGWATKLSAGGSALDSKQALFSVSMELTPEGLKQVDDIAAYVFQYIRLLQQKGIEDWRYDEQHRKANLNFRFKEKIPASSYVMSLSGNLQDYPATDVLRAGRMMEHYDPALLKKFIDQLVPENLAMTVVSPALAIDKVELLYQVSYAVKPLPDELIQRWNSTAIDATLVLPEANPFIPQNVALKPVDKPRAAPYKIAAHTAFPVWTQQDDRFGVPKASVSFTLKSPAATDTVQHRVLKALMVDMVKQQLNEFSYPASIAGLNYSLSNVTQGLSILVFGYDEKQGVLLTEIIKALRQPQLDRALFDIRKARLARKLKNAALDRPYKQVLGASRRFLVSPDWTPTQKLDALNSVTLADLKQYVPVFFEKLDVEVLSYGNRTESETLALVNILQQGLFNDVQLVEVPEQQLRILRQNKFLTDEYPVDHPDSVAIYYHQGEDRSIREQAKWRLLAQMMSNPFFSELRTEQQLGYVVAAAFSEDEEMPGFIQLVQSSVVSADELQRRITAFNDAFASELSAMNSEEFSRNKAGLIADLLEKDESYLNTMMRYLGNLKRENHDFDFKQQVAEAVEELNQDEMIAFYQQQMLKKARAALIYSKGGKG